MDLLFTILIVVVVGALVVIIAFSNIDQRDETRAESKEYSTPPENGAVKRPPSSELRKRPVPETSVPKHSFVAGPPIRRDEDFLGRWSQRGEVRKAITDARSLQILGLRRMGKTSLLEWARRHASEWTTHRLVHVDAQMLAGEISPGALVLAIARGLPDRSYEEEAKGILAHSGSDSEGAGEVLESFPPLVLLVDEAANLARKGHKFDESFLGQLRARGQDGKLTWISASHRNLRDLFSTAEPGVNSAFLNDEKRIWVGQLEDEAARSLVEPLGEELAKVAIDLAAGFAYGLQWLADSLSKDASNLDATSDVFSSYMNKNVYSSWWRLLKLQEPDLRPLIRQCVSGLEISTLASEQRRRIRDLVLLGLVTERDGLFFLPGAAWRSFVEEVKQGA